METTFTNLQINYNPLNKKLKISGKAPTDCDSLIKLICKSADYDFYNIEIVDVSQLDVSDTTIFDSFFEDCSNIRHIIGLETWDTHNAKSMCDMFGKCGLLTEIKGIENFDTYSVIDMSGMFFLCDHIKSLDISNFNFSNTTNVEDMFCGCNNLICLDVDYSSLLSIRRKDRLFSYCDRLEFEKEYEI